MRRALVTVGVVLLVLGLGGWLADNYVRNRAETRAADALQTSLGLAQKPDVTLGGFPFSLAFVTKSIPSARLSAQRVSFPLAGKDVAVTGVLAESDEVRLVGDRVQVDRIDVTGVLDYGTLADLTGMPMSYGGTGRVKASATTRAGGQEFTVSVTAAPTLDADADVIRFTRVRLDEGSESPVPLTQSQLDRLVAPIRLTLPDGVSLTALLPSQGGVAVGARASDLSFRIS